MDKEDLIKNLKETREKYKNIYKDKMCTTGETRIDLMIEDVLIELENNISKQIILEKENETSKHFVSEVFNSEETELSKYDEYKALYMQNPCNILTEENLDILEKHCKNTCKFEHGERKKEHEIILELLIKYKEQQKEIEDKDRTINNIIETLWIH